MVKCDKRFLLHSRSSWGEFRLGTNGPSERKLLVYVVVTSISPIQLSLQWNLLTLTVNWSFGIFQQNINKYLSEKIQSLVNTKRKSNTIGFKTGQTLHHITIL